jgi:hypothetical protein
MEAQNQNPQPPSKTLPSTPLFDWILKSIYGLPASITTVTGWWKTGKTDFALSLKEHTQKLGLIREFSSNIECDDPEITFVDNFQDFDMWEFNSKKTKLFFYDEVIESSGSRDAMTTLNKMWVRRIPQISKARLHIVAITQEENLMDSIFRNQTFSRGIWRKAKKDRVTFQSLYLRRNKLFSFNNIPRTNIHFDPYHTATFHIEGANLRFENLSRPMQVLIRYGEGKSFRDIQGELGLDHVNMVRQDLQVVCRMVSKMWLEKPDQASKAEKLIADPNCEVIPIKPQGRAKQQ